MTRNRRVIANIVLTLDGHTTGPDGPYDMSCIAPHGVTEQARDALVGMTSAPVALLGRRNYQGFSSYWPTVADDSQADSRDRQFASWLNDVEKIVFSKTLTALSWNNSELASADPLETIRGLRASGSGDIRILSSQSIIRQLLDVGEIDRLEITLAPQIVAGGERLFHDYTLPLSWRLVEAQPTDSDAVRLTYDLRT